MTIRHVVAWRLAAQDSAERDAHAAEIGRRLAALAEEIPGIESLTVGPGIVEGNWDVALVADFVDLAALDAYQVHPSHQAVVGYVRGVAADRVAVDFAL